MNASRWKNNSRTLLWVIVAVALLWLISPSMWLFRSPLLHGCGGLHDVDLKIFPTFLWGFAGMGWLVHLLLALWVWADANDKGQNGVLWGLLVFFTSIVGLLVYLLLGSQVVPKPADSERAAPAATPPPPPPRPAQAVATTCVGCNASIQSGYKVCPYCGLRQRKECPACGAEVQPGWKVCPHCETRLGD